LRSVVSLKNNQKIKISLSFQRLKLPRLNWYYDAIVHSQTIGNLNFAFFKIQDGGRPLYLNTKNTKRHFSMIQDIVTKFGRMTQ